MHQLRRKSGNTLRDAAKSQCRDGADPSPGAGERGRRGKMRAALASSWLLLCQKLRPYGKPPRACLPKVLHNDYHSDRALRPEIVFYINQGYFCSKRDTSTSTSAGSVTPSDRRFPACTQAVISFLSIQPI